MEIIAHHPPQRAESHVELAHLAVGIVADVEPDVAAFGAKIEMERPVHRRAVGVDEREAVLFENVIDGDRPFMLGLGGTARRACLVKLDPDEPVRGSDDPALTHALVIRHPSLARSS